MKRILGFTAIFLLLSPMAFAAVVEDWSNVNQGKDAGTYADTLGSKIEFVVEDGSDGAKVVKLTSTLVQGGWCGVWRAIAADLSQSTSLKFKVKASAPGQVEVDLQDAYNVQYIANVPVTSKDWTEVTILLSSFIKNPYYTPPGAVLGHPMDLSRTNSMNLSPHIPGASVVEIGPIEAVGGTAAPASPAAPAAASSVSKSETQTEKASGLNWVVNGDFKSTGGWSGSLVTQPGRNNEPAAFLENTKLNWTQLAQRIDLPQPAPPSIEISAWMKCAEIVPGMHEWEKCRIMVTFSDAKGTQVGGWPTDVALEEGSKDWAPYNHQYQVPTDAASANLQLVLGNCTGKAWFSGLKMEVYDYDLKPLPAGIKETHPDRRPPLEYKTDNWLFDPGFETPGTYDWQMARVVAEGRQSQRCLFAENAPPNWNLSYQDVSFQGKNPAQVVFGGWVKTEGVIKGAGSSTEPARLSLYFRDGQDRMLGGWQAKAAQVAGTTSWTYYEKRYVVPPVAAGSACGRGLGNCSGKAWFDDLSLSLLDKNGKKMLVSRTARAGQRHFRLVRLPAAPGRLRRARWTSPSSTTPRRGSTVSSR